MIDQDTRTRMARTVRSYMDEEITAFEFDEALEQIADQTEDPAVNAMACELWFHYDDYKDHKIVASKEQWDYFNRILLLLDSPGELEVTKVRCWTFRQLIAACSLAGFLLFAFRIGWGAHLNFIAIPFGVVSIFLSFWHSPTIKSWETKQRALTPFSSVSELLHVHRRVTGFSRRRYPPELKKRRIRDAIGQASVWLPLLTFWLMLAPIPLFFQTLPETYSKTRVKMP